MFIWTAIDINDQLSEARACVQKVELPNPCMTLPLHISLKISFEVNDCMADRVMEELAQYFSAQTHFEVTPMRVEQHRNVVWITMQPCKDLLRLHRELDAMAEQRFGVAQHPFDKEFLYHASLFFDDGTQTQRVYEQIKDVPIPKKLRADTFVIGASVQGLAGTYAVKKTISVNR